MKIVKKIIKDVKQNGDLAILKYNKFYDDNDNFSFRLTKKQIKEAYAKTDRNAIETLIMAAKNIRSFAKSQMKQFRNFSVKKNYGVIGQKIIPLDCVGCYVPGGRYPLPSTALMTVIPAKVAGVKKIIVCSPKISPISIVAADIAGADEIFNIGGVQAIVGMAYGTRQVPMVDKIVGPGNKYVAEAKRMVYGDVGIDFIAGPSEVLIIADETAVPKFIAADLLAQAEHDMEAKANLLTTSKKLAEDVACELKIQLAELKTKDVARISLRKSKIQVVKNLGIAIDISNSMAPEHLELQIKNPEKIISKLSNYGSLFIGNYSAEVFGDYCSGTNHTLPTGGAARYASGLSVKDFIKITTFQKINKNSKALQNIAAKLAKLEGLDGHKKAALARLEKETLINKKNLIKLEKELL
jgi:histidinol dehydrogenase